MGRESRRRPRQEARREWVGRPIPPWVCYAGIVGSFGLSFALFADGSVDAEAFFYLPLALLIGWHTLHAVLTDRTTYTVRPWRRFLLKAAGKTLLWGGVLWGVQAFYAVHPLYRDFTPHTRHFLEHVRRAYLWLGLPYFLVTERWRYNLDNALGDPFLRLLALGRALARGRFRRAGHRLARRSTHRFIFMTLIRVHYTPIMVEQIYKGVHQLQGVWTQPGALGSLVALLPVLTALAWLIDSNNGAMGYFWESNLTKTRFRGIDPYPFHWFVVLICYVPFIGYAAQFVPFPALPETAAPLITGAVFNRVLDVILVTALFLYMLSGTALAFATSNLCYKRIQTRGPYRIVRHPATTCKLIYFALAFFRFQRAWTLTGGLCFVVWTAVYVGRALVEEQYLREVPTYRRYMQQTRYRFLPRVC